jgi:hypothetical protein
MIFRRESSFSAASKALRDSEAFAARLKPCPFKAADSFIFKAGVLVAAGSALETSFDDLR